MNQEEIYGEVIKTIVEVERSAGPAEGYKSGLKLATETASLLEQNELLRKPDNDYWNVSRQVMRRSIPLSLKHHKIREAISELLFDDFYANFESDHLTLEDFYPLAEDIIDAIKENNV